MNAIARLRAMLGLDTREFQAGVRTAQNQAGGLSASLKRVGGVVAGAFSIGAIAAFGRSVAQMVGEIKDVADNLNINTGDVAALGQVAAKTGTPLERVAAMLGKIQGKQADVARGNEEAIAAFQALGISVEQVIDTDPVKLLELIALKASGSGAAVAKLGDIFGEKLGTKTLDLLRNIANDGLKSVSDQTVEAIDRADELSDRWSQLMNDIKMFSLDSFFKAGDFIAGQLANAVPELDVKVNPLPPDEFSSEWNEFVKSGKGMPPQPIDVAAVTGMSQREVDDFNRNETRKEELRAIQAQARAKEIQAEIDKLRSERMTGGLSGADIQRDSQRAIGAVYGRDIQSLPILELQARVASAAEQLLATNQRMEILQQQEVELSRSTEWRR